MSVSARAVRREVFWKELTLADVIYSPDACRAPVVPLPADIAQPLICQRLEERVIFACTLAGSRCREQGIELLLPQNRRSTVSPRGQPSPVPDPDALPRLPYFPRLRNSTVPPQIAVSACLPPRIPL